MNSVCLTGRVSTEPVRGIIEKSGVPFIRFDLEVTEKWFKHGISKEQKKYFRISQYGDISESTYEWLRKGHSVSIQGALDVRNVDDKTRLHEIKAVFIEEMIT